MLFIDAEGQAHEQDLAEHIKEWHPDWSFKEEHSETFLAMLHDSYHDADDPDVTGHEHAIGMDVIGPE
jgi:hypothetical protein